MEHSGVVELADSTFWYHHFHLNPLKRAQLILKTSLYFCNSESSPVHTCLMCAQFVWMADNQSPPHMYVMRVHSQQLTVAAAVLGHYTH